MDKDEAEHLVRMIVGNWRHSTAGCYSRDMDMGKDLLRLPAPAGSHIFQDQTNQKVI